MVIIGLIIGGVLAGKDMMKAATIRSQVAQLEKYNTAVNAFRAKYNALPGDMPNPVNFFPALTALLCTGASGQADGNGQINSSGTDTQGVAGETVIFWYELSQSGLINENITTATCGPAAALTIANALPPAKMTGSYVAVAAYNGLHYWGLFGAPAQTAANSGDLAAAMTGTISPNQAFQIDVKIDDGLPISGTVQSGGNHLGLDAVMSNLWGDSGIGDTNANLTGGAPTVACYDTTNSIYATNGPLAKEANICILKVRSSF
jgi:hypothetical protein